MNKTNGEEFILVLHIKRSFLIMVNLKSKDIIN